MVFLDTEVNEYERIAKNSHQLYWHDLDKIKFFGLLTASSLALRTCFHPLALIKTRLQTEQNLQQSTYEMIRKIRVEEGLRGFYRGYSVSICALLFEPVFMGTLEMTRTFLNHHRPKSLSQTHWDTLNSSLSAGTAALVQQTFLVPIDITTQRMMIKRARVSDILGDIYFQSGDGIRGFYKGYLVTLSIALPFNSIIWTLYWKIQSRLERLIPRNYDQVISPVSSAIAALLTSLLTQPIDVIKTRLQVSSKRQSLARTALDLLEERGYKGFFAGTVPRALIILPSSVIMMSLYEIIKRISVREEGINF